MKRNTSLPWLAALALGVAALTAAPAVASPDSNDYPEEALKFATVAAYRYGGNQPVDLVAKVVDDQGAAVEGANVTVEINTSKSARPAMLHLQDKGNGNYIACDAAFLEGPSDVDTYLFKATLDRMHPAEAKVKSERSNLCGGGEPQMRIASVQAAKLDGSKQPLSVLVELVNDEGNPVHDAKVLVRSTDLENYTEVLLPETSSGTYSDCNVARFSTKGPDQISVMVQAWAEGYAPALAWGENIVGYLCTTPVQHQDTARRTR